MSNVPEQVRRAGERATELFNQVNGATGEPPADPAAAPAEPAPQVQPVEPPAPEPAPAPAEPTPAPAPAPAAETDWAHKYKTLQGVFTAEQGRWNAEKKVLETRLAALEQAAKPAPPAAAPAPQQPAKLVTDKDVETYGPELMDVIKRQATEMAHEIVAQKMAELKPQLDQTREQVSNVSAQVYKTHEERFYGELSKEVPDWEQVNTDQRWLDWLAEVDELSGVPRQAYLDNASGQLDHKRVAKLFTTFKDKAGLNPPATPPAPVKPPVSPTPRTVGTASAPRLREPQTGISRTEIAAHYRRGSTDASYRSSPAHKEMEARIAQAMASGQIIEA